MGALPAAALGWRCSFQDTCPAGPKCGSGDAILATLEAAGADWRLVLADATIPASAVDLPGATTRHFAIAPMDADADAAALLSIFADGTAFLTTQGAFMAPASQTLTGKCSQEGS